MAYRIDSRWPPRLLRRGHGKNRRRFARIGTTVSGFIALERSLAECEVIDVSLGGARVRAPEDLTDQAHVTLGFGRFGMLAGEVAWRRGGVMGIKFVDTPKAIHRTLSGFLPQFCMAC